MRNFSKEYKGNEYAIKFLKGCEQKPGMFILSRKIFRNSVKVIIKGMKYCVSVDTCTVFELCSWLVMEMGDTIAKKFLPTHTTRHYKDRAEEIRKESKNNGGC